MTSYVVSESRADSYIGDRDGKQSDNCKITKHPAEADFSVNATTVKLPAFWTHQAACWFRQAEIQFALHGITSDTTKFYHVFASIDQNAAQHLMDIIAKPPEGPNKYEILKRRLLQQFHRTNRGGPP